jgi:hypothetical protein
MQFVMQWSQGAPNAVPPGSHVTLHGESVVLTP